MYLAYDSTINLLMRPRILKFIIDGISVESAEELQSCDERQLSNELILFVNKLILINTCCAQSFVRFSPRLNALVDTINTQEDFWYAPMAEMNFGPPQMSITSGPKLTYGTIISSTQLFTQAQCHFRESITPGSMTRLLLQGATSTIHSSIAKDDKIDSARREWERATPENLRRMHSKDLHKILNTSYSSLATSAALAASRSSSKMDFANYLTGNDLTVPLLSSPRLIKRPFDPLICENTILSRATAMIPLPARSHMNRGNSPQVTQANRSRKLNESRVRSPRNSCESLANIDPWFASMEDNNSRRGLEVNLVLLLCQALEGVKSPRLAVRDRQLIGKETAMELNVFFDFLECNNDDDDDWKVAATVMDADANITRTVYASKDEDIKLPARLQEESTVQKIPIIRSGDEEMDVADGDCPEEERSPENIITSGVFDLKIDTTRFLPLLGKLMKSVVDSLVSAQFG